MKNLHLLPTDKPSRLLKRESDSKLILYNKLHYNEEFIHLKTQNIYITSDEVINDVRPHKEKWYLEKEQILNKFPTYLTDLTECKLVIMTTDPNLIKDGVQKIDDEFLEWFVKKNPSCEKVKVELHVGSLRWSDSKNTYKIIIPKEEPKHTYNNLNYGGGFTEEDIKKVSIRQETLEEFAKRISNDNKHSEIKLNYQDGIYFGIEIGAKWQAEKMYSEEEVLKLLEALRQSNFNLLSTEEWFKKNKK